MSRYFRNPVNAGTRVFRLTAGGMAPDARPMRKLAAAALALGCHLVLAACAVAPGSLQDHPYRSMPHYNCGCGY